MKRFAIGLVRQAAHALVFIVVGIVITLAAGFTLFLGNRPELKVWHEADLDAEFVADSPARDLEDYLAIERRVFAQLDERVYARIGPEDRLPTNRYNRGSLSDPRRWDRDWNRSFEFSAEAPTAGILLLHGMSDSPYSLRSLGERLHSKGAWVVGLRLPGHGHAPSALVEVRWEDMAAAVRLAMRHLRDKLGQRPLYIVGYSNGGPLAVHYALSSLDDATLPRVAGLALISPSIGVTPLAALAVWQARIGHFLGLDKLAWSDIRPEYDPYKYGSFAVNAGDQVHRLTAEIRSRLTALAAGRLDQFPPILAFQSVVDATVSTRALIEGLFARLDHGRHELVLFDLNRISEVEYILLQDPKPAIEALFAAEGLPFAISLLTNEDESNRRVIVRHKRASDGFVQEEATKFAWPQQVYSLSHVALPFPEDDPLYGRTPSANGPGLHLGRIELRGERNVLQISASEMLRLRWNPFYPYLEARLTDFLCLDASSCRQ